MHHHRTLQRRLIIATVSIVVLGILIAVPIATNDDLRYDLAKQANLIPGRNAEQLADADDGALLIVLPLDHGTASGTSPWLYQAQFIAWPDPEGIELENLESGERATIPLETIEFTAANGDGSLVLLRGYHLDTGELAAYTIEPGTMLVEELADAEGVPNQPGDWDTSIWEKTAGACNRPSPHQRFVGCFTRADLASYFAGDWQLDLQVWGDYETVQPMFRGQGFLPFIGFAQDDTVVFLQNELGIWRMDVPDDALEAAPTGRPYSTPVATPHRLSSPARGDVVAATSIYIPIGMNQNSSAHKAAKSV